MREWREKEKEIKTVPSTSVEFLDAVVLEVNMGLELKLYESVFSHILKKSASWLSSICYKESFFNIKESIIAIRDVSYY